MDWKRAHMRFTESVTRSRDHYGALDRARMHGSCAGLRSLLSIQVIVECFLANQRGAEKR